MPSTRLRLVAAITRTSTLIVLPLPHRSNSPSCNTRKSFACSFNGKSPTSSKNIVPPSANSNRPTCRPVAPVNAPFSCPNSSLSINSPGNAEQFTFTNGCSLHPLFPRPRLSQYQNRHVRLSHLIHLAKNFLDTLTPTDQIPITVHAGDLSAQIHVLRLQAFLQTVDLLLGKLTLGNVDQNPHESDALTVFAVNGLTPSDHPANGAIGPDHSILAAVLFFLRNGCFYCLSPWKILRMHALSPRMIAGLHTKRQKTHNQEVFLGPLPYVGAPVPIPDAHPARFERKPQTLFAVAKRLFALLQRLLRLLAVRDVANVAEKVNRVFL